MDPATPIRDCRFAAIDFESAGAARGRTDVPVQVGAACWAPRNGLGDQLRSFLRSDQPITWSARKVHGIGADDLAGAPGLMELWPELRRLLGGAAVVAHGKGTEKRFLRAFPGHGFGPWIDTLLLARAAWPELEDHSLSSICAAHELDGKVRAAFPGGRWHDALYDSLGSVFVLAEVIRAFDLGDAPLGALVRPDTSAWHRLRHPR